MNELSLFTGAGGGILGTHLLGWKPIGYVEFNDYCQQVLAARIRDGYIPEAPIFGDIREFLESGEAREYRGFADVVTAGFPCQPFSQAGKRQGAEDERNMWPETAAVISAVRPERVFLENTLGIKSYLPVVRDDLRRMGYCVPRRAIVAAASVGAGHIRRRVWILAYANSAELREQPWRERRTGRQSAAELVRSAWWACEPGLARVARGVPNRLDRTRAIGNSQVPAVAASAWILLS